MNSINSRLYFKNLMSIEAIIDIFISDEIITKHEVIFLNNYLLNIRDGVFNGCLDCEILNNLIDETNIFLIQITHQKKKVSS